MVYLVGAGPGDAGLLTIKAREILETAEVVIYDRLADEKILNCVLRGVILSSRTKLINCLSNMQIKLLCD